MPFTFEYLICIPWVWPKIYANQAFFLLISNFAPNFEKTASFLVRPTQRQSKTQNPPLLRVSLLKNALFIMHFSSSLSLSTYISSTWLAAFLHFRFDWQISLHPNCVLSNSGLLPLLLFDTKRFMLKFFIKKSDILRLCGPKANCCCAAVNCTFYDLCPYILHGTGFQNLPVKSPRLRLPAALTRLVLLQEQHVRATGQFEVGLHERQQGEQVRHRAASLHRERRLKTLLLDVIRGRSMTFAINFISPLWVKLPQKRMQIYFRCLPFVLQSKI